MKQAAIIIAITILAAGKVQDVRAQKTAQAGNDYIVMKNGKVISNRNGKDMVLGHDITLSNGTRILPDGKVIGSDGRQRRLRNGETVPLVGKMQGVLVTTIDRDRLEVRQYR